VRHRFISSAISRSALGETWNESRNASHVHENTSWVLTRRTRVNPPHPRSYPKQAGVAFGCGLERQIRPSWCAETGRHLRFLPYSYSVNIVILISVSRRARGGPRS